MLSQIRTYRSAVRSVSALSSDVAKLVLGQVREVGGV
jgi:hypothetical protein